jgi:hypothetical protein
MFAVGAEIVNKMGESGEIRSRYETGLVRFFLSCVSVPSKLLQVNASSIYICALGFSYPFFLLAAYNFGRVARP